jgi:hypothetical protein
MRWLLLDAPRGRAAVMNAAAAAGQMGMCQLLRAEGCRWTNFACEFAATAGHCDLVRWLREAGCPWQPGEVRQAAASSGSVDILAYLQQAGELLQAADLTAALAAAGAYGRRAAAVWLRQQGAEWPAVLQYQTVQWSLEAVAWARAEGCTSALSEYYFDPYSEADAAAAATSSSDECDSDSSTDWHEYTDDDDDSIGWSDDEENGGDSSGAEDA